MWSGERTPQGECDMCGQVREHLRGSVTCVVRWEGWVFTVQVANCASLMYITKMKELEDFPMFDI